ncbi:MAG: AsmA-like C-terminal region-containing protein, partial [Candidatus Paceibacterota bacterium]
GKIPYPDIPLDLLEGNIKIDGETWLPVIRMKFGKNNISANLVINHFWDYFINHSDILGVNGNITSEYLNVVDFTGIANSTENTDFQMPDSIYLKLHCNVDSLVYGKFIASGLETWFSYKPGLLSVSSVNMQAMSGRVSAGGAIIADNQGKMLLHTSGDLYKIDIYKLFDTFNNFGQDFIVAENIKGSASGSLNFSAQISPELKLLTKTLTAESDFVIENGELINFEPVTELSSFVALSELKHIRFSTLKNSILIKDEKVYIPQMDINSSAFNITVSGTHGFENYFEYKLRLSLNEILAGKAKKAKKENEEFGIVEDNGPGKTNLYLSITGTPDDFKIRYDKKEAVNKIKSDLQVEKKLLKTILNEELGLFKGDSLKFINTESNPQNGQFIMDWGDEKEVPEKAVKNRKEKKLKKQDPLFEITWEEEDPELK